MLLFRFSLLALVIIKCVRIECNGCGNLLGVDLCEVKLLGDSVVSTYISVWSVSIWWNLVCWVASTARNEFSPFLVYLVELWNVLEELMRWL